MNFNYDIKFTDNTPQLHEALDSWAERVLTIWGMKVQDYAQLLVPTGTEESTGIQGYVGGALKQSLTYALDLAKKTVTIGSNLVLQRLCGAGHRRICREGQRTKNAVGLEGLQRQMAFYPGHESPPVPAPGGGESH